MRWQQLFADLEAQAEAIERAERAGEVDERTRAEIGSLQWRDRARAAAGAEVRVRLAGGTLLTGVLARVGPDWVLLDEGAGREAVVPASAVLGMRGLGRYAAAPGSAGVVESRLGLRTALRGIARDRSTVRLHLVDGAVLDGALDRVGGDFVDVAALAPGAARRRGEVRDSELVPFAALAVVRRTV